MGMPGLINKEIVSTHVWGNHLQLLTSEHDTWPSEVVSSIVLRLKQSLVGRTHSQNNKMHINKTEQPGRVSIFY